MIAPFLPIEEISGGGLSFKMAKGITALASGSNDTAGQLLKMDVRVGQLEHAMALAISKTAPTQAKAFVDKQNTARHSYTELSVRADQRRKRLAGNMLDPNLGGFDITNDNPTDLSSAPCNCETVSPETKDRLDIGRNFTDIGLGKSGGIDLGQKPDRSTTEPKIDSDTSLAPPR